MDHFDERPPCVQRADATVPVRKHNTLHNKLRQWQAKSAQAESNKTNHVGHPRRRKPSMPPLPWDKSE